MVNFGVGPAFVLGVFLAVAGAGLYFLRSIRPELSKDHDIFFAAVGLVCGLILMFYGWRLEPALQFGQFLLAGTTIFFAYEAIRLRGIATEQARRNTPIVDDDRPVSSVYRDAELDDLDSGYPRLRGTDEPRSRRPPKTRSRSDRYGSEESPRSRRPRTPPPPDPRYGEPYGDPYIGETPPTAGYDDYPPSRSRRPRPTPKDEPPLGRRPRRSRPSERSDFGTDVEATPVDYQPLEGEDDADNGYGDRYEEGNPRGRDKYSNSRYDESNERSRDQYSNSRYAEGNESTRDRYGDRDSYDPMSYGQPYDDGDTGEQEDESDRYDREERGPSEPFDY
ncbi:MAG: Ycf66 family protein [Cyanobacteriota bacterium]|nr:Ycf66 family protein [Cyanobacteriota bacterium]